MKLETKLGDITFKHNGVEDLKAKVLEKKASVEKEFNEARNKCKVLKKQLSMLNKLGNKVNSNNNATNASN